MLNLTQLPSDAGVGELGMAEREAFLIG